MRKLNNWWQSLGKYSHEKAKWSILINFIKFESHELSVQERIALLDDVRREVELILIQDLIKAENEVKACKEYFTPEQKQKAKTVDVNFDKPLSELNKNY
jgi:hypothetical protein